MKEIRWVKISRYIAALGALHLCVSVSFTIGQAIDGCALTGCDGSPGQDKCSESECCPQDTFCCGGIQSCCPKGYRCTEDNKCLPPVDSAVCIISGDPHYTTFDQRKIDYQGKCKVLLTKSTPASTAPEFAVYSSNYIKNNNQAVSYIQSLEIVYNKTTCRLERVPGPPESVDLWVALRDDPVNMKTEGRRENIPFNLNGMAITREGVVVTLRASNDVIMWYDGTWTAKVHVPKTYCSQLQGLCGNFDSDPENDYTLIDGSPASSPNAFGDSYIVPDPEVPDNGQCLEHKPEKTCGTDKINLANRACYTLIDEAGPFACCIKALSHERMQYLHDMCVFDAQTIGYEVVFKSYEIAMSECMDAGREIRSVFLPESFYDAYATIIGGSTYITFDSRPIFVQYNGKVLLTQPTPGCDLPYFEIRAETRKQDGNDKLIYLYMVEFLYATHRIQVVRNNAEKPSFDVYISKVNEDDLKHSLLQRDIQIDYKPSGLDDQGLGTKILQYPFENEDIKITVVDFSIVITATNGVKIVVDILFTNFYVPKEYKSLLTGLFGNYDADVNNDNTIPGGGQAATDTELCQGYLIFDVYNKNEVATNADKNCAGPEQTNNEICGSILDVEGIFKPCLASAPIRAKSTVYSLACNYNFAVLGKSGICQSLAGFSAVCRQFGIEIDWQQNCGCNVETSRPDNPFVIPAIPPLVFTFPEIPRIPPLPSLMPIPPLPALPPLPFLVSLPGLPSLGGISPMGSISPPGKFPSMGSSFPNGRSLFSPMGSLFPHKGE